MSNIETNLQNAFETTLTAGMSASDLSAVVASMGSPSLTSPCYLVIDPDDDQKREYILFDGTFGALTFVTSNIAKRYLAGSAYGANITHDSGAVVRMVPLAQHFEDLNDRIDNIDHGDLDGLGDNDHTQYLLSATHAADDHSSLAIDADMVDGQHASEFAAAAHDHDADYADIAHVNSRDGHPIVTTSLDGFMSAADKATLDALEASGGGITGIVAGTDIDVSGTSVVTVSHENTSSVANINNAPNEHIDTITFDGNGHVQTVTKQTMSAGDIGAATTGHDHAGTYAPSSHTSSADHDSRYAAASHATSGDHDGRYYLESEVDNLLAAKAPTANPDFTGTIDLGSTNKATLIADGTWVKLQRNGQDLISGNGASLYLLGVGINAGAQYEMRCTDTGSNGRQIFMRDDSSTERNKFNIRPTSFLGGECLKWDGAAFQRLSEGDDGPTHEWFIAERIQETSGDAYVVRDVEGLVANTDDRAILLDVIITLQDAVEEIQMLKAEVAQLRGE